MTRGVLVAGLSARMLVESARDGGIAVEACDLFGDLDTRAAASAWAPAGEPGALHLEREALLAALRAAAARGGVSGWIAGSGFEGRVELLREGAALLPLIGNSAECVAQVRSPAHFYGRLAALGIDHPRTALDPPVEAGWLEKDAGSCGGWRVRRHRPGSPAADPSPGRYFQREMDGLSMSMLFLADGRSGCLLGFARQLLRAGGARPFVQRGSIGPVPLTTRLERRAREIVAALAAEFGLCGLNGVDFLLAGGELQVLELNPRPTASIAVLSGSLPGSLLGAHLEACRARRLPAAHELRRPPGPLRGHRVVYARRGGRIGPHAEAAMHSLAWCHDRPASGISIGRGAPLCSVSAQGADPAAVIAQLERRRQIVLQILEQTHE